MPHALEKFYNAFGGLNTRENRLQMNPDTLRKADNIRYSFKDELVKANGFQHKDSGAPSFIQQFEYRFRDINTGEAKSEILAVGTDGNLYRKKTHTLTFLTTGAATSYSVYYDEVSDGFVFDMVGLAQVAIGDTTTLDQLKTALNALTGVSVDIVDDAGNSVTSSQLAYLLDCVIDNDFQDNSVFYWEVVPHPNLTCVSVGSVTEANLNILDPAQWTVNGVPFPTTVKAQDPVTYPDVARDYEGISVVNLNNVVYISDGGFPMKYDGKCVYRAGVPHTIEIPSTNQMTSVFERNNYDCSGITTKWEAPGSGYPTLPSTTYSYKFRYGFTDYNGATYYGDIIQYPFQPLKYPLPVPDVGTQAPNYSIKITQKALVNAKDFPIFSAKISGTQFSTTGLTLTLNVVSGHNILPGMIVRQTSQRYLGGLGAIPALPENTGTSYISFYAKVTAVTETTITLEKVVYDSIPENSASRFVDQSIINAYYVNDFLVNKRPATTFDNLEVTPAGFFLEIYRTKADQQNTGPFYRVFTMPVTTNGSYTESSIYDGKPDNQLSEQLTDQEPGGELPRSCKYLTAWQNQLIQAGYTPDRSLAEDLYPSFVQFPLVIPYSGQPAVRYTGTRLGQPGYDQISLYTESFLCDFQSIYWADALSPEGFPQDGLHEFAVDTFANDEIKGIAPNKDAFFAFKERSTGVLTGSLAENDIVLEILEDDIGCASHLSIKEVGGSLFWLDSRKGFYSCVAGRLPVAVGFNISDYQRINAQKLDYSQAKSANLRAESLYICSVGTTTFVFDYANQGNMNRACWYLWNRLNGKSVLATADDELLIYDGTRTWKMKITNTRYDFTDHKSAISMDAQTAWITLGQPIIDKNFQHIWINSIQGGFSLGVTQWANYLDYQQSEKTIDFIAESSTKKAVKMDIKANLAKLSAISFGFKNSEKNTFVRIQGWEIEYAPDYDRGEGRR